MFDFFRKHVRILPLLLLLLAFGCAKPVTQPPIAPPSPHRGQGEVEDLRVLPQDLNAYLRPDTADKPLMPEEQRSLRMEEFRRTWLAPWVNGRTTLTRHQAEVIFTRYERSPAYGNQGIHYGPESAAALHAAAGMRNFPNMMRKGVTVNNTNLRGMPTYEPRFANPSLPGEGYPFDYLQHTALPPGTPVLMIHASQDGSWVLVESFLTFGWLPAKDVAYVNEGLVATFLSDRLGALIKEHVSLPEAGITAGVGAVFPMENGSTGQSLTLLVPVRDPSGGARLVPAHPAPGTAVPMPMPMTPRNVAAVGNQFMGQPYGWGGLDGKRDCSAVTHDLFVPFGFYLPRNSGAQATAGAEIPLGDYSNSQKESTILSQGIPFATLIWMKGHIMVYVGQWKGRPLVFHAPWGLHTFSGDGARDGRLVLGRVVVTTLHPGEEVPEVGPQHALVNRVRALTILARP